MKKNIIYIFLFVVLFIIGFFIAYNKNENTNEIKRTQILLGTVVEIQVKNTEENLANVAIEKAFKEIKRIDLTFSSINPESEVYKINYSKDSIIQVSKELFWLVEKSNNISKLTNNAFDVSLENLITLWGFERKENFRLPDTKEINGALKNCGWVNVNLMDSNSIKLLNNVKLNFSAIAKGYAVDQAINVLVKYGIKSALVNAGGEIKVLGNDWIIGIQHPRMKNALIEKVKLNSKAVATSGDYEQFFEVNGKRYHHIINPQNGYPANGCQSVTIIANNDLIADAFATAVFVMGPKEGMILIEKMDGIEGLIIDSAGNKKYSSNFHKFKINYN
ncbi:MAG: FAD:protein FMN transferase [Ignavibacterium sp.]